MRKHIGHEAEELLHQLIGLEDASLKGAPPSHGGDPMRHASRLVEAGLAVVGPGGEITLTPQGREEAVKIVRRHRLAERLLVDVLDVEGLQAHDAACRFEHILRPDVEEKICTLLGHPKGCPHGGLIPPGRCCREAAKELKKVVSPVADLEPEEGGTVAYIHADGPERMNKLLATGILPGQPIRLLRRFPSYVVQVGNTQYAIDRDMADAIYVRLSDQRHNPPPPSGEDAGRKRGRRRRGWRWWSRAGEDAD